MTGKDKDGFIRAGDMLKSDPLLRPPSSVQMRLIDTSANIRQSLTEEISYQHSILCQTGLPYRQSAERRWERRNGRVMLEVEAGRAYHPQKERFFDLPLPFGPKARLILIHLNSEAIRTRSRIIEVEDSLTAFVRHLQNGREPNGEEIRKFKDQLSALAAASIRMATAMDGRAFQINTHIIHKFDLWFPKNPNQRVLWPRTVEFDGDYFTMLSNHAVPLDQRAVGALAHSAMGLDIYAWLAQRLCRIHPKADALVPWVSLHQQFGHGYKRIRKFREVFLDAMKDVLSQYPAAQVQPTPEGLVLKHSTPPVRRKVLQIGG